MQSGKPVEVLYMSYDGMTDPLGQSQVIPYLQGLSKLGYHYTLISFEKQERFEKSGEYIGQILKDANIDWVPLTYTKSPPVLSTMYDVYRLRSKAMELHRQKNFSIVHCRSYISALVGLEMKKKRGVKFIFDMRGFWADERVDGGLWNLDSPIYKRVYNYFKKKEKEFFSNADHTISLTEAGKREIQSWKDIPNQPIPIQVIPCCADLEIFSPNNINYEMLADLRIKFGIRDNDYVLSYLGSIGTWYLLDEMLDFFKCLLLEKPEACFLFLTNEPKEMILKRADAKNIPLGKFIVAPAPHHLVPTYLVLSAASIFFIKPVFSKKASSPTKQGEIMGVGLPYVCNSNIGDVDEIVEDTHSGYVVKELNDRGYADAIKKLLHSDKLSAEEIRKGAFKYYSLEEGVKRYHYVYQTILA